MRYRLRYFHLRHFTASLGTCAPGKPSVFTVNRTRVDIASRIDRQVGASGTVVHGVDDDLVETLLDATTALFGTQAVHFSTGNLVREISTVLMDG